MVYYERMARLTITLSDERHQQLKMRAARQGKSIANVIECDLHDADQFRRERILATLAKARENSAEAPPMSEDEFMEMAVKLSHQVREEIAAEQTR